MGRRGLRSRRRQVSKGCCDTSVSFLLWELVRVRGKEEQAVKVEHAAEIIHPVAVIQDEHLGLGACCGAG